MIDDFGSLLERDDAEEATSGGGVYLLPDGSSWTKGDSSASVRTVCSK
jgi:hypothetical protein